MPTDRAPVGIDIRAVRKSYGGTEVVHGVDLAVPPGASVPLGVRPEWPSTALRANEVTLRS
ncbi:MAG: hypothetical protein AAF184_25415 [Pseudomonadota bacterium]